MHSFEGKHVLVAGAAGLVGSHLLNKLKGFPSTQVRSIYRSRKPSVEADNIVHMQADLTDLASCKAVVEDIDFVVMLASRTDRRPVNNEYLIHNQLIHYQLLEASHQANVEKYLWMGSATAYLPSSSPLREEMIFAGEPADAGYAFVSTARFMERLCHIYATKVARPMSVISLRPTAIYGEYGDFNIATCHVLPALLRKVVDRQNPIEVWGDGKTQRDFIHAADVADACCLALEITEGYDDFNIGSGVLYSVIDILNAILEADGFSDAKIEYVETANKKANVISVDCSKAKRILNFTPQVSIEQGIDRTLKWYRKWTSSTNSVE